MKCACSSVDWVMLVFASIGGVASAIVVGCLVAWIYTRYL